jgi:GTP-binding protein
LAAYNADLAARPEIVAVTKSELPGADEVAEQLAELCGGPVHRISAATGQGLEKLLEEVWKKLLESRRRDAEQAATFDLDSAATVPLNRPKVRAKPKPAARRPPHLSGPTAELSDENPPSNYNESST